MFAKKPGHGSIITVTADRGDRTGEALVLRERAFSRIEDTRALAFLSVVLSIVILPSAAASQTDQQALARQILEGDDRAANHAVARAERLLREGEEVGPELRGALITALESQNRAYRDHVGMVDAGRRDPEIERAFWGEGYISLTSAVVMLRHPETIEALAGALTIGEPPARYLAKFGEEAAPVLLAIAEGKAWRQAQAGAAMRALRLMIEEPTGAPLSPSTLDRIRKLVRTQLTEKVHYPAAVDTIRSRNHVRIRAAVPLALAVGDPSLRELAETIAREPAAIRRLGIEDASQIADIQRRAARELAERPRR